MPGSNLNLVAQTTLDPSSLQTTIRAMVQEMNPELPVRFSSMREVIAKTYAYPRFRTALVSGFAVFAVFLAVFGIYGVLSYLVEQRKREIGVRMALGAQRARIFALVAGTGMRTVLIGIVCGLAGAIALTRILQGLLYRIEVTDPVTYLSVTAVLILTALLASSIPAVRAVKADPLVALRED